MAAGLKIDYKKLNSFKKFLEESFEKFENKLFEKIINYDSIISVNDINHMLLSSLRSNATFWKG